jgi:hypothetical protein
MIKKSAVLVGNDEFWHSAIVDESSDSTYSNDSCDEQPVPTGLPAAHHQLLSSDVPSYDCLTGYDHRGEDTSASLFFDEDDDSFSLDDDEEDSRMTSSSCCRQEKMSSVKKRGGGWLLGFARLQSRSVDEDDSDNEEDEKAEASSSKLIPLEQEDGLPGLVRTDSASDFSFSTTSCTEDDNSTTTSTSSNSDNDSLSPKKKSVGFNSTVKIQPIPHSSTYSPMQRRKMYSSSLEVRKNKIRNKKEYRFDGYDWRNVTEEWEMSVDMVTGELVHPVHNHML